jgi:exodeoxyribonuclease VII small subunit
MPKAAESFEDKLRKLEEIANKLEAGETPLEESLTLFSQGAKLAGELQTVLAKAEQQFSALSPEGEQQLTADN